jgi:hypothetical protein
MRRFSSSGDEAMSEYTKDREELRKREEHKKKAQSNLVLLRSRRVSVGTEGMAVYLSSKARLSERNPKTRNTTDFWLLSSTGECSVC